MRETSLINKQQSVRDLKFILIRDKKLLDRLKVCETEQEFLEELISIAADNSMEIDRNSLKLEIGRYKALNLAEADAVKFMNGRNNNCFNVRAK